MKKLFLAASMLVALLFALGLVTAKPASARTRQQDDKIAHGKYVAGIAGCVGCHTVIDRQTFTPTPGKEFAGGEEFDLGPLGKVYSKNLTSDKKTGLGDWTDDEIKTAITTGVSKDGLHLFPIMPYVTFSNMSDEDVDDLVAYLRTIPPIENQVERRQILPPEALPKITRKSGIVAPDSTDTAARGRYLFSAILVCNDCHTPVNPETQQPVMEKYLAGGQPFEGPWGTVYGGNITPDEKTGIGTWTDADIERVLRTGVRPNGRVAVVMPFFIYQNLDSDDMKAVTNYLKNDVKPVDNVVPAAKLNEGFERFVTLGPEPGSVEWFQAQVQEIVTRFVIIVIGIVALVVILLVGGVFLLVRNRRSKAQ
jgi:mono/diheme cytochrome c family protein